LREKEPHQFSSLLVHPSPNPQLDLARLTCHHVPCVTSVKNVSSDGQIPKQDVVGPSNRLSMRRTRPSPLRARLTLLHTEGCGVPTCKTAITSPRPRVSDVGQRSCSATVVDWQCLALRQVCQVPRLLDCRKSGRDAGEKASFQTIGGN
jgi:hypothetical protein